MATTFAKVVNGEVVICNQYGGRISSFRPQSGGAAVFVDVHPGNGKMLVTTDSGKVIICNNTGGWISSFDGNGRKIVLARWQGDDIFSQNADGSCVLRSSNGGWKHPL